MNDPKTVKPTIEFDDFLKADLRVGTIEKAELHPNGDKLLVLTVDFGPLGKRTICAGIRQFYGSQEHELALLVGVQAVFCINLAPRKMRGIESQGMILAAANDDHTRLGIVVASPSVASGKPFDGQRFAGGEVVG